MRRREDGWEDGRQDWGNGGGWSGEQGQGYGYEQGQGYGQPTQSGEAVRPGQTEELGQSTTGTRWPTLGGWDQPAPDDASPTGSAGYDAPAGYDGFTGYDGSAGYGADAAPGYGGASSGNSYAGYGGAPGPFGDQDRTQAMDSRQGIENPGPVGRYADADYPPQGNFRPQSQPPSRASGTSRTFGEFPSAEAVAPERPRTPRPYGRLSIFTLMDGMTAEFDRLSEEAAEGVRKSEPDTLVYVIHVVPKAPMQRIIYEIYRDRAAFEIHESQPHILQFTEARKSCVLATNIIDLRLKYAKVAALFRGDEGQRPDDREQWSSWDGDQSFDGYGVDGQGAGSGGWSAGRAGRGAPAALPPPTRREPRALEAGARPAGTEYPGGRQAADQYSGGQYDPDQYSSPSRYGEGQYSGGEQRTGQYSDQYGGQYPGQYDGQYSGQQDDGQYAHQDGDQYYGQYEGQYDVPAQYGSSGQYNGPGQYGAAAQYDGAGQYSGDYQGYGENGGYDGGVPPRVPQAPPWQQERPPWEDEPAQYPSRRYSG